MGRGQEHNVVLLLQERRTRSAGGRLAHYSGEPLSKQLCGRRADGRLLNSCTVLEVKRGGGASGQGCRGNSDGDGGGSWEGHGESQIVLFECDLKTSGGSKPPWQ